MVMDKSFLQTLSLLNKAVYTESFLKGGVNMMKRILTFLITYAICFGIVVLGVVIAEAIPVLGFILVLVFTFYGWRYITFVQPVMFIWMPLAGWVAYFVTKFFVSAFLGIFITPYHLAKSILGEE